MNAPRANTYQGLHAAHYDLIFADKPYADEARFVAQLLREHGTRPDGRLLDVACGTGRHAVELAALGFAMTGVDISEELLSRARLNAKNHQAPVAFIARDMRCLDLDDGPFDAAICLFDSIGYAVTTEAILATLESVRKQLAPEGLFAAEFLHAPAMLRYADPVRVRRWRTPADGELLRVSETYLDPVRGTYHVRYELLELDGNGRYKREAEEHLSRFFTVEEMRLLLQAARLRPLALVAAYEPVPTITDRTWHVLALARRT